MSMEILKYTLFVLMVLTGVVVYLVLDYIGRTNQRYNHALIYGTAAFWFGATAVIGGVIVYMS